MRINPNYKVRQIGGENIVTVQGNLNGNMTKIISLNPTALLLWNEFSDKDFTCEDVADFLMKTYDIAFEQAIADSTRWVEKMRSCGII
jgi:hypothetical protein